MQPRKTVFEKDAFIIDDGSGKVKVKILAEAITKYAWKNGFGFFKADANMVAEEIFSIGEEPTAEQILEKGRNENTELHKCFEWDDSVAAEKYRLEQARMIPRLLVFKRTEEQVKDNMPEMRVLHITESHVNAGYKPITTIVKHEDEYQKLLKLAYAELHALKIKYQNLQELDYILSLIP